MNLAEYNHLDPAARRAALLKMSAAEIDALRVESVPHPTHHTNTHPEPKTAAPLSSAPLQPNIYHEPYIVTVFYILAAATLLFGFVAATETGSVMLGAIAVGAALGNFAAATVIQYLASIDYHLALLAKAAPAAAHK